jgi:hypothetical protein
VCSLPFALPLALFAFRVLNYLRHLYPYIFNTTHPATDEDGTKIAIYGGQLRNDSIVGELWILDVVQFTWTQGLSGPIRMYAACTIADDQLLLWGGSIAQNIVAPVEMLIYNLTLSQYVKQ